MEIFHFQVKSNPVYSRFLELIRVNPKKVTRVAAIPFMPIQFFKSFKVTSRPNEEARIVFRSSSTTGTGASSHELYDPDFYKQVSIKCFESVYGSLNEYRILALLPGYLERGDSSLVFMVQAFMDKSAHRQNGFYLQNVDELKSILTESSNPKTLLLGVSFALLDLANSMNGGIPEVLVMETGGMKGRRKELIRTELHKLLNDGFGTKNIHSEYGMTELLSQAYAKENGLFEPASWMKISVRDTSDPFSQVGIGKTGGINVIDLANIDSCCFVATSDLGKLHEDGRFEVLGRFDHSDVRGCNLMYA